MDSVESQGVDGLTPGEMLKAMRNRLKISPVQVARKLRLSKQIIYEIENDNFEDITSAVIYIRGYLRSYAKLVDLAEEDVLNAFDAMNLDFEKNRAVIIPLQSTNFISGGRMGRRSSRRLFWWGIVSIGLVVMGMITLWWLGQTHSALSASAVVANPVRTIVTSTPLKTDVKESTQPAATSVTKLVNSEQENNKNNNKQQSLKPNYRIEPATEN